MYLLFTLRHKVEISIGYFTYQTSGKPPGMPEQRYLFNKSDFVTFNVFLPVTAIKYQSVCIVISKKVVKKLRTYNNTYTFFSWYFSVELTRMVFVYCTRSCRNEVYLDPHSVYYIFFICLPFLFGTMRNSFARRRTVP